MEIEKELKKHFDEDRVNFKKIDDSLNTLIEGQKITHDFMKNLSWLNDISRATELLKKPSLWIVALVLGAVALFGGVKALVTGIIGLFIMK